MKPAIKFALWSLGGLLGLAIIAIGVLVILSSSPMSPQEAAGFLDQEMASLRQNPRLAGASLSIHAPQSKFNYASEPVGMANSTFHSASVGKLFTTVLIARQIESGTTTLASPVQPLLPPGTLDGLVRSADAALVTVEDLLAHTSGMADYFAGPTSDGSATVAGQMVENPDRSWTVADLLEHSRRHQLPQPRGTYLYSDTGYLVAGLVVEALYGKSFEQVVHGEIFEPLGMDDSYYPWRSSPRTLPAKALRPSWIGSANLAAAPALTADQAGGGVATTSADLQRFARALADGRLLKAATIAELSRARNLFEAGTGIHYGLGMMQLRFGDFMPLLDGLPAMYGHMGILGTQVFVEPTSGTTVVINLGADGHMADSVQLLITAASLLPRLQD